MTHIRWWKPHALVAALAMVLAMSAGACGDLDDVTEVKDLRVLAIKTDPAGILIDLDNPGAATEAALQARLTALVVDPTSDGSPLTFTALGCPNYLDAITAATGQGTRACSPPGAPSPFPEPLGSQLATVEIVSDGTMDPVEPNGIQYEPVIPGPSVAAYGLTPTQVGLFFSPQPTGVAVLDQAITYNRDFGIDAIVDMAFFLNGQQALAIKRIPYWPRLEPAQIPNQNPNILRIDLFRVRDEDTGDLLEPLGDSPTISLSAGNRIYALPVPAPDAVETYPLRVRNTQTREVETQTFDELLQFEFYATSGLFFPPQRFNTPPILSPPGSPIRLESELSLPPVVPASGKVDIWITVREERAGANWAHTTVTITP